MPLTDKEKQDIRERFTYHGDEGTSGYLLSEDKFETIFSIIEEKVKEKLESVEKEINLATDWATEDKNEYDVMWKAHYMGFNECKRIILSIINKHKEAQLKIIADNWKKQAEDLI